MKRKRFLRLTPKAAMCSHHYSAETTSTQRLTNLRVAGSSTSATERSQRPSSILHAYVSYGNECCRSSRRGPKVPRSPTQGRLDGGSSGARVLKCRRQSNGISESCASPKRAGLLLQRSSLMPTSFRRRSL